MKLPKISEEEAEMFKRALKQVSDNDLLDFLQQKTSFSNNLDFETKCNNKIFALIYHYEKEIGKYEDCLNNLQEKYENALTLTQP